MPTRVRRENVRRLGDSARLSACASTRDPSGQRSETAVRTFSGVLSRFAERDPDTAGPCSLRLFHTDGVAEPGRVDLGRVLAAIHEHLPKRAHRAVAEINGPVRQPCGGARRRRSAPDVLAQRVDGPQDAGRIRPAPCGCPGAAAWLSVYGVASAGGVTTVATSASIPTAISVRTFASFSRRAADPAPHTSISKPPRVWRLNIILGNCRRSASSPSPDG